MPPLPATAADEEAALFEAQTHARYEAFTIVFASFLFFTMLCGLIMRVLICRMASPSFRSSPMRTDCSCQVINALKMANVAVLSTLAGCLGVTARGVGGLLTAQNAANLVNVISAVYGALDMLPHGRADIINGAIGSLAAQSAIGIYADGVNSSTRVASYANLATNVSLIVILIFLDIDRFDRRADTPFIRKIVSIEEIPYKYLKYCYCLTGGAWWGRIIVIAISSSYSVMSLILFYCNRGGRERADEHVIALAPLVIISSSLLNTICCDLRPRTCLDRLLYSQADFDQRAQEVRCEAAVDAIIEADNVEDAWERVFRCNNFRLYRDFCREGDGKSYTTARRDWLHEIATAGYLEFIQSLARGGEGGAHVVSMDGARLQALDVTALHVELTQAEIHDAVAIATLAVQTASADSLAAQQALRTAVSDEKLAAAVCMAKEAALAAAQLAEEAAVAAAERAASRARTADGTGRSASAAGRRNSVTELMIKSVDFTKLSEMFTGHGRAYVRRRVPAQRHASSVSAAPQYNVLQLEHFERSMAKELRSDPAVS